VVQVLSNPLQWFLSALGACLLYLAARELPARKITPEWPTPLCTAGHALLGEFILVLFTPCCVRAKLFSCHPAVKGSSIHAAVNHKDEEVNDNPVMIAQQN